MEQDSAQYTIKEISSLIDEEQHVLRYWEREFSELNPQKNSSGNRIYSEVDLVLLKQIKNLLREQRKTVQEAKLALKTIDASTQIGSDAAVQNRKKSSEEDKYDKEELLEISKQLDKIVDSLRS